MLRASPNGPRERSLAPQTVVGDLVSTKGDKLPDRDPGAGTAADIT